ncbi:MAG: flagellar basal body P-ring formation chaperone FlgA [Bryobacteraceae bacterium]
MKKALGIEAAQIELLDYSKSIFPSGKLEFSRATLSPPPANDNSRAVVWRGRVVYGDHQSASVWARVRISVSAAEYVAAKELIPGSAIEREDIRETRVLEFPSHLPPIQSLQEIFGHSVRRTLKAGEILRPAMLVSMPDVNRGDAVTVIIQSGAAWLKLAALAQSSGRTGDVICLQNPENHRLFRGTVIGKGQVSVNQTQGKEHAKALL